MKLVDRIKNMFTEEVEEERPIIKKEVMHVEINAPKPEVKEEKIEQVVEEPVKEEKTVPIFFDDKDFDTLEKPKIEKEENKIEEEKHSFKDKYKTKKQIEEQKPKTFKPSPIISPVYGILDKNYKVDDIETKKVIPTTVYYEHKELTIDDIRKKAYGTLEDDIETTLFGVEENPPMHEKKDDLIDNLTDEQEEPYKESDEIENDDLENFDNYESENSDTDVQENVSLEDDFDLSDDIMNSYEKDEQNNDENISDSDLFDLIDSMYEKSEK